MERLPEGLHSQLGPTWPGGQELSFGQWQKLALSRGYMRSDALLIMLDEPTASLDAETEHELFERYAQAAHVDESASSRSGEITILVSHRFSTVRMADLIVVLDGSRLAEVGSHEQLMQRDGPYADLYRDPGSCVSVANAAGDLVFPVDAAKTYQMTGLPWRLVVLLAAVLLGTCAAIVDTTTAFACSCAGISTTRALREADAVFRGTVVSKEVVGRGDAARTDIRFAVDRVYKGAVFDEQVVASEHDEDACGLDPEVGSTWVIFAIEGG